MSRRASSSARRGRPKVRAPVELPQLRMALQLRGEDVPDDGAGAGALASVCDIHVLREPAQSKPEDAAHNPKLLCTLAELVVDGLVPGAVVALGHAPSELDEALSEPDRCNCALYRKAMRGTSEAAAPGWIVNIGRQQQHQRKP